jgi:hypothetical protein
MKKVLIDYESTGNGYLEIGRTALGQIGYVGHVPATTIRVRRLRDGYLQIIGQKVVYFRNFGAKNPNPVTGDPRPNELIHYKSYSPLNTFYGIPDILSAVSSLIGDSLAAQYNIDYFQNKAVPRYIITLKGAKLSGDAEDKMFRFLQTGLKSQSHRTLYIPLPGDSDGNKVEFNMEPIENGIQDGSFKEYRKQNRDDILIAHQVPISKLGGTDSGLAAAMSERIAYRRRLDSRPRWVLDELACRRLHRIGRAGWLHLIAGAIRDMSHDSPRRRLRNPAASNSVNGEFFYGRAFHVHGNRPPGAVVYRDRAIVLIRLCIVA